MKTYIDHNTTIQIDNLNIPKVSSNGHYKQFLEEQAKGEAELIPYVPPAPTWDEIRAKRNSLLTESDWAIMEDANPKPSKQAWLDYRQALRDIPQNFTNPEDVIWPQKP